MKDLSRRGFLAAGSALALSPALPRLARAEAPLTLQATTRTLDIDGRAATVWGLVDAAGRPGLTLAPGQRFALELVNELPEPTLVHWHGQIPPNAQDGVPGLPAPLLAPGERRAYDYAPAPGSYWMHSHIPLQEMRLLAAPLVVQSAEDLRADRQEVVMFLHDFAFAPPEEVLAQISAGATHGEMAGMDHGSMDHGKTGMAGMAIGGMDHSTPSMGGMKMGGMDHSGMSMPGNAPAMVMDLNDYDFDAYLANDRTLGDPEVTQVDAGGEVLLRIINGASATAFWIELGALEGRLVAVDGHAVQPVTGRRFALSMAQRLDIVVRLPGEGAFPVLALREGARERAGIVLATPGASVPKLAPLAEAAAPPVDHDLAQEGALRALAPLAARPAGHAQMLMLGGAMQPYRWTIDDRTWEDHAAVAVKSGARVELSFHNMSMMAHPMHLHGHVFQVVAINGQRFAGARRDTVLVPPGMMVTIAFDAGEAARWMLHCHHMPHLATGMMTELAVSA